MVNKQQPQAACGPASSPKLLLGVLVGEVVPQLQAGLAGRFNYGWKHAVSHVTLGWSQDQGGGRGGSCFRQADVSRKFWSMNKEMLLRLWDQMQGRDRTFSWGGGLSRGIHASIFFNNKNNSLSRTRVPANWRLPQQIRTCGIASHSSHCKILCFSSRWKKSTASRIWNSVAVKQSCRYRNSARMPGGALTDPWWDSNSGSTIGTSTTLIKPLVCAPVKIWFLFNHRARFSTKGFELWDFTGTTFTRCKNSVWKINLTLSLTKRGSEHRWFFLPGVAPVSARKVPCPSDVGGSQLMIHSWCKMMIL